MKPFTRTTNATQAAEQKRGVAQKTLPAFLLCVLISTLALPPGLQAQQLTPVNLASSGNYVVLSQTGVSDVPSSHITGNVGAGPIAGSAIGVTCAEVSGTISAVDATGPVPCSLVAPVAVNQAVVDMQTAYTNAAGRPTPNFSELGAGNIGGMTLIPGLYKWSTNVFASSGFTLSGGPNSVWIFQIAGNLTVGNAAAMVLSGGAQAGNIFWQVGGSTGVTLGTTSLSYGNMLSAKQVIMYTGATLVGRALAQTQVTLQSNTITSPGSLINGVPPVLLNCSDSIQPTIAAGGILNSASWTPTVAAGSIASAFGNNFGSSLSATVYPLLPALWFTSFKTGNIYAPLFMTSCSQVNMQIPWEDAGLTQVALTANVGGLVSAPQTASIAAFAPGIFAMNQTGSGQGAVEIASTGQLAAPLGTNSRPILMGEYVVIYCTGLGAVSNQPATGAAASASPLSFTSALPTVTIGGVSAQVTFSGLAPGFVGLYQVNAQVPGGFTTGPAVSLILSIGGVASNTVTIATQ